MATTSPRSEWDRLITIATMECGLLVWTYALPHVVVIRGAVPTAFHGLVILSLAASVAVNCVAAFRELFFTKGD